MENRFARVILAGSQGGWRHEARKFGPNDVVIEDDHTKWSGIDANAKRQAEALLSRSEILVFVAADRESNFQGFLAAMRHLLQLRRKVNIAFVMEDATLAQAIMEDPGFAEAIKAAVADNTCAFFGPKESVYPWGDISSLITRWSASST